jgi:hypothetical protein
MVTRKTGRAGATVTFSVSVDADTERVLRALADAQFGGNVSAVVADMADQARHRLAAAAYLRRAKIPQPSAEELSQLEAELLAEARPLREVRRRRRVA